MRALCLLLCLLIFPLFADPQQEMVSLLSKVATKSIQANVDCNEGLEAAKQSSNAIVAVEQQVQKQADALDAVAQELNAIRADFRQVDVWWRLAQEKSAAVEDYRMVVREEAKAGCALVDQVLVAPSPDHRTRTILSINRHRVEAVSALKQGEQALSQARSAMGRLELLQGQVRNLLSRSQQIFNALEIAKENEREILESLATLETAQLQARESTEALKEWRVSASKIARKNKDAQIQSDFKQLKALQNSVKECPDKLKSLLVERQARWQQVRLRQQAMRANLQQGLVSADAVNQIESAANEARKRVGLASSYVAEMDQKVRDLAVCEARAREIQAPDPEVKQRPAAPVTPTRQAGQTPVDTPSPRPGGDDGSFFIVMSIWGPEIPGNLPAGTKRSEYLGGLSPARARFVQQPQFAYGVVSGAGLSRYRKEMFQPGTMLVTPITVEAQRQGFSVSGVVLMKVVALYTNPDQFRQAIGSGGGVLVDLSKGTGKFTGNANTDQGPFKYRGGPFQDGWSPTARRQAIGFAADLTRAMDCFIATEIYGRSDRKLSILRRFRDTVLLPTAAGRRFVSWYYSIGPRAAGWIHEHPLVKSAVRIALDGVVWGVQQFQDNASEPNAQATEPPSFGHQERHAPGCEADRTAK